MSCLRALVICIMLIMPGQSQKKNPFDLCDEKLSVWQMSRGTVLAVKFFEKCVVPLFRRSDYTPFTIQRIISKLCLSLRLCLHKYKDLKQTQGDDAYERAVNHCVRDMESYLVLRIHPEHFSNISERALASVRDVTECAYANHIMTDDIGIAIAAVKWTRTTLF